MEVPWIYEIEAAGLALLNGGSSNAIGGLCNGFPASHTWMDASGQYGPALLDGTTATTSSSVPTVTTSSMPATAWTSSAGGPVTMTSPEAEGVTSSADKIPPHDELYAGDGFDVCTITGGAEMQSSCEY